MTIPTPLPCNVNPLLLGKIDLYYKRKEIKYVIEDGKEEPCNIKWELVILVWAQDFLYVFSNSVHWMDVETMTSLKQWAHFMTRSCILNTILHWKKTEKFGEILLAAISWEKYKVNLRNHVALERKKSAQRLVRLY